MKKVLIAGATGYLGTYLVQEAKQRGYWVRALVRTSSRFDDIKDSVDDLFVAEATRPETLQGVCDGIEVIVSALGVAGPRPGDTTPVADVDYGGNHNILGEALKASVKKFIYVAFINFPAFQHLDITHIKEKFISELQGSGLEYCVMRPTAYFSDMGNFIEMAKKGTAYLIGHGRYRVNPIHGADLAKVCIDMIDSDEQEVLVGGPREYTYEEAARLAFSVVGKDPKIKKIPAWPFALALKVLRPFISKRKFTLVQFMLAAFQNDAVTPKYGSHTLEDYFKELSEQ